jgi:hypothetical protein
MLNPTDGETRRLGKYHHGEPTKVVSIRLPAWKADKARKMAEDAGMSLSEWMERQLDTQPFRIR